MAFVNNYIAPAIVRPGWTIDRLPDSELYGPDPYDLNFAYPLHPETLQNDRLKLVPFIPSIHADAYWAHVGVGDRPKELYRYYPFFFPTLAHTLSAFEQVLRRNPHAILFAALDKTRAEPGHSNWGGALAGIIGILNTVPHNLTTELGFVLVFPAFRHTHVAKDMVGLLLRYTLQLPSASPPGLGFRRVQWSAHPDNAPSAGLAARMGMRREGVLRWSYIVWAELNETGKRAREGGPFPENYSVDSVVLALCWDEWEGGVQEHVQAMIEGKR